MDKKYRLKASNVTRNKQIVMKIVIEKLLIINNSILYFIYATFRCFSQCYDHFIRNVIDPWGLDWSCNTPYLIYSFYICRKLRFIATFHNERVNSSLWSCLLVSDTKFLKLNLLADYLSSIVPLYEVECRFMFVRSHIVYYIFIKNANVNIIFELIANSFKANFDI